jgi:outer membrane protein assembly factor BamB
MDFGRRILFRGCLASGVSLLLAACGDSSPVAGNSGSFSYPTAPGFHYDIPVQPDSPWPEFRRDRYNSANSPVEARYYGDQPWGFSTGKGIFSPPIVDREGTAYFGSADQSFYAVGVDGRQRWSFPTDGIFDSAGVIGAYDPKLGTYPITIGNGAADPYLFRLRSEPGVASPQNRVIWKYLALPIASGNQAVNWWEGHAVLGPDGTVYAGNTGGAAYAINPDGSLKWEYTAGNSVWTIPPILDDGSTFWGTLELSQFSLDSGGHARWLQPTVGFNTSSFMRGSDGTLYAGSFDGSFYARDAATGLPRWSYKTNDLIYGAPAESFDTAGNTTQLYVPSADGSLYALSPAGALRWKYDSGDPIRSSPAVGKAPTAEKRDVVYFGSANGKLYAINADDGSRRWSFDTTLYGDPILRDRNDLNSSPALGLTGVYIGSESGVLWYVPYDYCLKVSDPRCQTAPGTDFADAQTANYYVTPGGNTVLDTAATNSIAASSTLTTRLVVRQAGATQNAAMIQPLGGAAALASVSPSFGFDAQLSGDGKYLYIRPGGILQPDTDYTLGLSGSYGSGTAPTLIPAGMFSNVLKFHTAPAKSTAIPLMAPTASQVSAFELSRLAIPEPVFLPSINQIGFDFYDLLAGAIRVSAADAQGSGKLLVWVIGARRDADGNPVPDPAAGFTFPLAGSYRNDSFILASTSLTLNFEFGAVPTTDFELRGQMLPDLTVAGASAYGTVSCPQVPFYGPFIILFGLCNQQQVLAASGTYISNAYHAAAGTGPANRAPAGVALKSLAYTPPNALQAGSVSAVLDIGGAGQYPAARHLLGLLLVDDSNGQPLPIDYHANLAQARDPAGNLTGATLNIPAGTTMPASFSAYVLTDLFPFFVRSGITGAFAQ